MTLRAIGRNPRRSLSTMLGVVLALTLILVSWGMVDTIQILVDRQYGEVERQDAELYFRGAARPGRAGTARGHRRGGGSRSGGRPAGLAQQRRAPLPDRARKASPATRRCTASSSPAAARRRCPPTASSPAQRWAASSASPPARRSGSPRRRPGSRRGPGRRLPRRAARHLRLRAAGADPARSPGRGSARGNVAMVRYDRASTAKQMRRRLGDLPGVVAYSDSGALREAVDEYLGLFYAFIGVMLCSARRWPSRCCSTRCRPTSPSARSSWRRCAPPAPRTARLADDHRRELARHS